LYDQISSPIYLISKDTDYENSSSVDFCSGLLGHTVYVDWGGLLQFLFNNF